MTGANAAETHLTGVNLGRDFQPDRFADLRNAVDGDPCPRCCATLALRHAIEVGHVFKLGTKYSEALGARFLDENEQLGPIIMGCYGIGINRILAAPDRDQPRRQRHHLAGVAGPLRGAAGPGEGRPIAATRAGHRRPVRRDFRRRASTCSWTTATPRPGVKFKDADLVGIPLRVVLGERGLKEGKLEIKWRREKQSEMIELDGGRPAHREDDRRRAHRRETVCEGRTGRLTRSPSPSGRGLG